MLSPAYIEEMPEAEIYQLYPHLRTRKVDLQLEGDPTPAIEIYTSRRAAGDPALVVILSAPANRIESIEVRDSRFHDEAGIHIGSSFGQLKRAHRKLQLAVGEGQYWVAMEDAGLSFQLAVDSTTEGVLDATGDLSRIPDSTLVLSIRVFGAHPSLR